MEIERQTLSIMKACEVVGVSRRTIYNWMAGGKIEYIRTAGGSVRIFADSLWRSPEGAAPQAELQHYPWLSAFTYGRGGHALVPCLFNRTRMNRLRYATLDRLERGTMDQPDQLSELFHQLNNQLGIILAHAELMENKAGDEHARARATQVVSAVLDALGTAKQIRMRCSGTPSESDC